MRCTTNNPVKLGWEKKNRKTETLTQIYKIWLKVQSLCAERISKMPTNPKIPVGTLSW